MSPRHFWNTPKSTCVLGVDKTRGILKRDRKPPFTSLCLHLDVFRLVSLGFCTPRTLSFGFLLLRFYCYASVTQTQLGPSHFQYHNLSYASNNAVIFSSSTSLLWPAACFWHPSAVTSFTYMGMVTCVWLNSIMLGTSAYQTDYTFF